MAAIIDTVIPSNTDKNILKAFFHGHIHGEYKIYNDDENNTVAVSFKSEEDATSFKLKDLDQVYLDTFHVATASLNSEELMKQILNTPMPSTSPFMPNQTYPNNHWYGKTLIGDTFTSNGTAPSISDVKWMTTNSISPKYTLTDTILSDTIV